MALTADIQVRRVGAEDVRENNEAPLGAGVTVYSGSIALVATTGYMKNAATPVATDVVFGIVGNPSGGTYVKTGPGITNSGAAGAVRVECLTGVFLLAGGTAGDALSQATTGKTVYVIDEQTVGATNGGGTRPVAGIQLSPDPTTPAGFFPIRLATPAS